MPVVAPERLRRLAQEVLAALGAPAAAAACVADGLVDASLVGLDSHGAIRIPQYVQAVRDGLVDPRAEPVLERDGGGVLSVDGRRTFGQVVAGFAVEAVLARLAQGSQSLVAVTAHHASHVGRLGAYVERLAARGYIGLAMVNNHGARPWAAPFGGRERRLSTNPIAFAAPRPGHPPLVVDLTTSATAEGKVRLLRNRGESAPEGWLIDAAGRPTRDPADLYGPPPGALLPLGGMTLGHKGFGLSLMVEVLAGALSGAGCTREGAEWPGNGFFCLGLDPAGFQAASAVEAALEGLIRDVKDTPLAEGFTEILVPGEPEAHTRARRTAEGIPLDEETWRQIVAAARQCGVAVDEGGPSSPGSGRTTEPARGR